LTPDDAFIFQEVGSGGSQSICYLGYRGSPAEWGNLFMEGFRINTDGTLGAMTQSLEVPWDVFLNPLALKLTPSGSLLIELDGGSGDIQALSVFSTYSVNPASGSLTYVGEFPNTLGNNYSPYGLQIDPASHFLLLSDQTPGALGVYSIQADGSVTPIPGSPFAVNMNTAPAYVFSTSGKYVLAIDANNNLLALAVAPQTGALKQTSSVALPSVGSQAGYWFALISGGQWM